MKRTAFFLRKSIRFAVRCNFNSSIGRRCKKDNILIR